MKRHTMTWLAVVVLGMPGGVARAGSDNARNVLATHRLTVLDGTVTTLAACRGELVVVNFWASWCAPCRNELPRLDQWNTAWKNRGARVIAISIDQDETRARRFVEETKLALTVVHDGPDGLARSLDIPSVPYTLLLDRDGNVIASVRGSAEADVAALGRRVEGMLAAGGVKPVQEAGVSGGTR